MPDSAICSGVTGTCSDRPTVSPAPVSAQVIITWRFMDLLTVSPPAPRSNASQSSSRRPTGRRRAGDLGEPEVAEIAKLPIDEDVLERPPRGLDHHHLQVAVDVGELTPAPVSRDPTPLVVQGPPVPAEARVRS